MTHTITYADAFDTICNSPIAIASSVGINGIKRISKKGEVFCVQIGKDFHEFPTLGPAVEKYNDSQETN